MAQAAGFANISYAQFQRYLDGPYPPPRQDNKKFRSDDLGKWLRERVAREMRVTIERDPDALDGPQELARKNKELADKTALENEVRRGELVEAEEVLGKWVRILMKVRTRILSMPTSLAPILAAEDDQASIQDTLEEAVREALSELSEDWQNYEDEDGEP